MSTETTTDAVKADRPRPSVLFVCVHDAGRSQMAAAYLGHLSGGRIEVLSAGSQPADQVNPAAVEAMREEGIDITAETPKILTDDAVRASDVVVTMGCGDECPYFPGKRYEDWVLEDPAGKGVNSVRPIRDEIKLRVQRLIGELLPARSVPAIAGDHDAVSMRQPELPATGVCSSSPDPVTSRVASGSVHGR